MLCYVFFCEKIYYCIEFKEINNFPFQYSVPTNKLNMYIYIYACVCEVAVLFIVTILYYLS